MYGAPYVPCIRCVPFLRFSERSSAMYGDLFAMDAETGAVVLLQTLDHGAVAQGGAYNLGVIAEDQGEYSTPAHAALLITVRDVNDHAPTVWP